MEPNSRRDPRAGGQLLSDLCDRIEVCTGRRTEGDRLRVVTDTTNFTAIDYGDVLLLGDRSYLILNNEREGRFGIDDQPKFWVKRAIDLEDGSRKVIKMVFREAFRIRIGQMAFECVRSPSKEARILDLVRAHPGFMTGFSRLDTAKNSVRVIDFIRGQRFSEYVLGLGGNHEQYFFEFFPTVLRQYIGLLESMRFLHAHREKHGDIRRDHILRDTVTGRCTWIDFDFNYVHRENMFAFDLFGLGNVLAFIVGRGDLTPSLLRTQGVAAGNRLTADDMNIVFSSRVMHLRKIYGYIPADLNQVLMHFSAGAKTFYEESGQLLSDLFEVQDRWYGTGTPPDGEIRTCGEDDGVC